MPISFKLNLNMKPSTWTKFLTVTKQLYEWFSQSVSLSVCPSVTPFWKCSSHHIFMKFSGVNTIDRSDVHVKVQSQRSKVKVTEVKTQFSCFWTVTPVWIHMAVACLVPSHHLNQCWPIVSWTPGDMLQWNLKRNIKLFIDENAFENVCQIGVPFVQG